MRIILNGCSGQMGRVVTEMVKTEPDMEIVAGTCIENCTETGYPVYSTLGEIQEEADVLIDFSSANACESILAYLTERKLPAVIATTGYGDEQVALVKEAAKTVPIVQSGNMSVGVNAIQKVVEELAHALKGFDIEIIEKHHTLKKDAPSGTAKMLFQAANRGREESLTENFGRYGNGLSKPAEEVGIHAIRAGNIVGEHAVIFAGTDEVVEVTHRAGSKKIFANGALRAAEFVVGKESGYFTMQDIL